MATKVFALDTKPGIQRDGTVFDKQFYNDGRWVRFQRGRPRKIGGYRQLTGFMTGPSRGIWVNSQNGLNQIFSGYSDGLQEVIVNNEGVGGGITEFTLQNFTPSPLNLWQFDGFYDISGSGVSSIIAHPGQNLAQIDSTVDTPVLIGPINGLTMQKIGTFQDTVTGAGTTTVTLAAANPLVGAGQTVTGTGIPPGTVVQSVSGTSVVLNNVVPAGAVLATFDNNVDVSGGVVVLHPYVFVFGNNGLIKNCSAGNAQDWVSADANETNVATGKIVQGLPVRGGSNSPSGLFWSLDSLVRVSYSPQTLGVAGTTNTITKYWRYDIISSQTSILSSQSVIEYDGIYYWCGVDRFLLYNGVVKEIPNAMNQNWFFDNLNYTQRQKVWATKVPRYGEIWWFYPRGNAEECTDAIIYNVRENTWYDAGEALGARRSAGYFSQVFRFPVNASWETSVAEVLFDLTVNLVNGSVQARVSTYASMVAIGLQIVGTGITDPTYVLGISVNGVKSLGPITGGSGYIDAVYTGVSLTGGFGGLATADITVSGGSVVSVDIIDCGANYQLGDSLSADTADLGGAGGGFSVDVAELWVQQILMSQPAAATIESNLTFSTSAGNISLFQHEIGQDAVVGQTINAIESYFETNDIGLVSGGPSEPSMVGQNNWLHLDRLEPDFIQSEQMELYITGRPYADQDDKTTGPYVFQPNTGKIDLREQRREMRLRFRSDVQGGNYQMGRIIVEADVGDVRGYSGS